ncbi:hypothetical protein J6590_013355 [Homalodisca vitripennis]|nr:hypothetical protein J6590_013355 [Homalodisca vitripennis]
MSHSPYEDDGSNQQCYSHSQDLNLRYLSDPRVLDVLDRSETVGLCDRYRTIDNAVMAAMRCSNFSQNPDLHLGFEDESEGQKKDIVAKVSSSTSSEIALP